MEIDPDRLDWNHLRAFVTTAEAGSLTAAARVLGLTQPTLGRQITALEGSLAVTLFERNGHRLSLTDAGHDLLRHARDMGDAARRLSLRASGQRSGLSGLVRVTASDIASVHDLPDAVELVRQRAPGITLEVIASDDIKDLMRRDADIAVRNVRPTQPHLVARLVREKTGHFYAATSYLAKRGRPRTETDLATHDWIGMGAVDRMIGYMKGLGVALPPEAFALQSESGLVVWELAKRGMGICPMDDDVAGQLPQMERVLPDILSVTYPIWLVTHREIHTSPRIRLVFDTLAEVLSSPAARRPLPL
jgi:DNA-binding transcriptional LysR family regulator